jgi:spore maturation protein SpmB
VIAAYLLAAAVVMTMVIVLFSQMPPEQMAARSAALGNGLLLTCIALFVAVSWYRRVPVYESFIAGAKEGFGVAVTIMPYLVAMLVAIGLLRSSGVLDGILSLIATWVDALGGDTRFVAALPTGLMNPFSGSGARAMMLETMATQGVDSFAAKLAAVFQGSTETTFYVLAVYFGAVNIKRMRHAIGCGLAADAAGLLCSIFIAYWFFA